MAGLIAALSAAAAVLCVATGLTFLGPSEALGAPAIGWFLATLGTIGGSAILAAGVVQARAILRTRIFVLTVLALLSGGLVGAEALAVFGVGPGLPDWPSWVATAGLWTGSGLYLVVLVEVARVILAERSRAEEPEGPRPG